MPKLKSKKRAPIRSVHVSTPRPTVNDARYEPTYQYVCEHDHISAHDDRPLTRCAGAWEGKPCEGKLTRFGLGSKGPRS